MKYVAINYLMILAGLILVAWSGYKWFIQDMPLNDLIPYKNVFGTNPIHITYLGLLTILFAFINLQINKYRSTQK